jgi:two-component system sensor histidine kinase KdpD
MARMTAGPRAPIVRWVLLAGVGAALVAVAAVGVAFLERGLAIPNASSLFLLAVLVMGVAFGPLPAVAVAVASFLVYDYFFTEPFHALTVSDPVEWLNLLLLLVMGVVVGDLAGRQRSRALAAQVREREARALFRISRELAAVPDVRAVLQPLAQLLLTETDAERVWLTLGTAGREQLAADTGTGPLPSTALHSALQRTPGDQPDTWVRVHSSPGGATAPGSALDVRYRVAVDRGGSSLGSIWLTRPAPAGAPSREETRVIGSAVDQLAQALERDRLATEAANMRVAQRSEALKTALLDSVSHDLRTPLSSIRAAAGSLMDRSITWTAQEQEQSAETIDREAERLDRLVSNLLDMSRIEAGELKPRAHAFVAHDLVDDILDRSSRQIGDRRLRLAFPEDLPPIQVDAVLFDQVMTDLLDNSLKYSPADAQIAISGRAVGNDGERIVVTVEDAGPGVPDDALEKLFDKFYRVARRNEGSRRGTGLGLSVVRGMVEAMGGTVTARRSELGGLAVDVVLPAAR